MNDLTNSTLERAYFAAVLLTGSAKRAEAVIVDTLEGEDFVTMSDHDLFLAFVRTALQSAPMSVADADLSIDLPRELSLVPILPTYLRSCYVLRILNGLSELECERLGVYGADKGASSAAQVLASMAKIRVCYTGRYLAPKTRFTPEESVPVRMFACAVAGAVSAK